MYENNAYKSWYWGSNISALSSGIIGEINQRTKIFLQYPDFLRKNNESWKKGELVNKISKGLGVNKSSAKMEFYPLLLAFHNKEINEDWISNFNISYRHGLEFSEHALISNLVASHKITKKLGEEVLKKELEIKKEMDHIIEDENEEVNDIPDGQSTLF